MMTPATHNGHDNTPESVLFVAFELREKTWQLGFSIGQGQKPRERMLPARDQKRLLDEIAHAKARFGLPDTAPVVRCDEAGREGFWRHRFLQAQGLSNPVVDSSSIAVNRRQRRAKSDALDVRHVRWMATELAWGWVRYQPESALSCWFKDRFGTSGKRLRRIGIVAVARKLLIALWRFLETGVLPEGAELKEA